jgi:hypothetical protein
MAFSVVFDLFVMSYIPFLADQDLHRPQQTGRKNRFLHPRQGRWRCFPCAKEYDFSVFMTTSKGPLN